MICGGHSTISSLGQLGLPLRAVQSTESLLPAKKCVIKITVQGFSRPEGKLLTEVKETKEDKRY